MHRFRTVLLLAICAAILSPAWAQAPLTVGDHHTINIDTGGPSDIQPTVTPDGLLYELHHPGATYIAIHFASFDLARDDYLLVSDAQGGQMYKLEGRGKMEAGTFWSRHVKGDTARLELFTVGAQSASGFVIDEYVAGFADLGPPDTKAICGVDDKENAVCYASSHPEEYDKGRAAARLLINGSGLCTGWLVSADDHLMTNEHCISSASSALNTDYEFMAEADNCGDSNCQLCHPGTVFSGATFIQDSYNLDYCLVQVNSGNPASTYGYLELDDRVAVPGEELYILQHPGGRAKEFGIFSTHSSDTGGICRVYSVSQPACQGSGYSDVGYYCDTEGGSSGSPVLARSSHKVIALHHCANCPNRGVPIHLIVDEIGDLIISSGLKVTPGAGLAAEGDAGGPFTPDSKVYTLENLNDTGIDYSVTKGADWVTLTDAGGHLVGNATTDVTVSINSNANSLAEGTYGDTINFINDTDHDGDTSRTVDLTVGIPDLQYSWTMDFDPGWTTTGQWAWGTPTGSGGSSGSPDPTSGYTGSTVYGYNLDGDYPDGMATEYLTTTQINCAGLADTSVKFWRWLGVESSSYDHAELHVSNDGVNWTQLYANGGSFSDGAWVQVEYDISAVADNEPAVYLRWTMGPTDGSVHYCGWNIDDVEIWGLGEVGPQCYINEDCDDGHWCNGAESCVDDLCVAGTAVDCADAVDCTDDSCNEILDQCDHDADDAYCLDDLFCNGAEYCDVSLDCQAGSDPCFGGACDEVNDLCMGCDYDTTCEIGEDCTTCPTDCISGDGGGSCGDGICQPSIGEDCLSCADDCNGRQGGKPSRRFCCGDGEGINPVDCGDDRCNESGFQCTDLPAEPYCCGDGSCDGLEDWGNCQLDCPPPICGDDTCDPGETQCNCSDDCGLPMFSEMNCTDGIDNDCDGDIDLDDPDCACLPRGDDCVSPAQCCSGKCVRNTCK